MSADCVYQQLDAMANRVRELLTDSLTSQSGSSVEGKSCTAKVLRQTSDNKSVANSLSTQSEQTVSRTGDGLHEAVSIQPRASAAGELCLAFGARRVLCMLNKVMFEEWKFVGNTTDYYNPVNSYIDEVHGVSCIDLCC